MDRRVEEALEIRRRLLMCADQAQSVGRRLQGLCGLDWESAAARAFRERVGGVWLAVARLEVQLEDAGSAAARHAWALEDFTAVTPPH